MHLVELVPQVRGGRLAVFRTSPSLHTAPTLASTVLPAPLITGSCQARVQGELECLAMWPGSSGASRDVWFSIVNDRVPVDVINKIWPNLQACAALQVFRTPKCHMRAVRKPLSVALYKRKHIVEKGNALNCCVGELRVTAAHAPSKLRYHPMSDPLRKPL